MNQEITIIKSFSPTENLFGGTTKKPCAFNSQKQLTDNAFEITRAQRETADAQIDALIAQTKKELQ